MEIKHNWMRLNIDVYHELKVLSLSSPASLGT